MSLGGQTTRDVLDHIFNNSAMASITNVFIGLHTGDPGEDGQGANEVSAGDYARISTAPSDWGAAAGADPSALANTAAVTFAVATTSWGTVTYMSMWSHLTIATEGAFIGGTVLGTARTIATGENANFPIGDIDVTAD